MSRKGVTKGGANQALLIDWLLCCFKVHRQRTGERGGRGVLPNGE
jgi:hypothetical protein